MANQEKARMLRRDMALVIGLALLVAAPVRAREACQERALSLAYSPQAGGARYWCWAAAGEMLMARLGAAADEVCQCRQAERVLRVDGCCAGARSCLPADRVPARCDAPRWPAFVERSDRYAFEYRTTCDDLPGRQDDHRCEERPLGWFELAAEICAGRPVLAAFHSRGSATGHLVVVKGFSTHGGRRVLVVDPRRLCPEGRPCEGELDEGFWVPYEEYVGGWDGLTHWVDFYGIRRPSPSSDRGGRSARRSGPREPGPRASASGRGGPSGS
jgi:hypothetical protein